jgi:hypothetical protein
MRTTMERILDWDFDQIIVGPGAVVENNEKEVFRTAFPWLLKDINMIDVLLESVLECPVCGFAKRETMPTGACQIFYECVSCKTVLRPKPGDCCVFCSYGSVKCPPMQGENCTDCAAE